MTSIKLSRMPGLFFMLISAQAVVISGLPTKYLDSDAARHFLGLDYKDNKNNSETVQNGNNNNKGKKPLDKVKKGERYV